MKLSDSVYSEPSLKEQIIRIAAYDSFSKQVIEPLNSEGGSVMVQLRRDLMNAGFAYIYKFHLGVPRNAVNVNYNPEEYTAEKFVEKYMVAMNKAADTVRGLMEQSPSKKARLTKVFIDIHNFVVKMLPTGFSVPPLSEKFGLASKDSSSIPVISGLEILKALQGAVARAETAYSDWYKLSAAEKNKTTAPRGKAGSFGGFFSRRRHGQRGQDNALELSKKVHQAETPMSVIILITNFFKRAKYERHSFALFLLDELKEIKGHNIPWENIKPNSKNLYDEKVVNRIMMTWVMGEAIGTFVPPNKSGSTPRPE